MSRSNQADRKGAPRALLLAATVLALSALAANDSPVTSLGSRRELFVDTHLIDTMSGAELRLHPPVPKEIVTSGEGLIREISAGGQPAFPGR